MGFWDLGIVLSIKAYADRPVFMNSRAGVHGLEMFSGRGDIASIERVSSRPCGVDRLVEVRKGDTVCKFA